MPVCSSEVAVSISPPSPTQNADAASAPFEQVAFGCFHVAVTLVNWRSVPSGGSRAEPDQFELTLSVSSFNVKKRSLVAAVPLTAAKAARAETASTEASTRNIRYVVAAAA